MSTWNAPDFFRLQHFCRCLKSFQLFFFFIFFPALCGVFFNWGSNHNESFFLFRSAKNVKQYKENETNTDFTTRISHLMCCQTGFELMKTNTRDGRKNVERGEKNRESVSCGRRAKFRKKFVEIWSTSISSVFVSMTGPHPLLSLSHSLYADFIMVYVATYQSK